MVALNCAFDFCFLVFLPHQTAGNWSSASTHESKPCQRSFGTVRHLRMKGPAKTVTARLVMMMIIMMMVFFSFDQSVG